MIKFTKDIKLEGKSIIYVWAEWCGPCKMIKPVLAQIDEVPVYTVNADEDIEFVAKHNIMSIPTLLFMDGEEVKSSIVGFTTKAKILERLT